MADTATRTAAPRKPSAGRTRTGVKKTAATATKETKTAKPAPAPEPAMETAEVVTEAVEAAVPDATVVEYLPHPDGPTRRYSKWVAPDNSGVQGTLYAPLGTTSVTVALGPVA